MKPLLHTVLLPGFALLGLAACSGDQAPTHVPKVVEAAKVEFLTKDFDTWYRYTYHNVLLSRDFKAVDTSGSPLAKKDFLNQLATRPVVAILNGTDQNMPVYQLCAYAGNADSGIRTTSKQMAQEELRNESRKGQLLPAFHFVDLNGVSYTSANTRGKILVVKFWYIGCTACVKEFPEINALVDKYHQNKEVVFVSLAMNEAEKLRSFLKGQQVRFPVVATSEEYLVDTLAIKQYPTTFIIGRDGKIAKVTTKASDLAVALPVIEAIH